MKNKRLPSLNGWFYWIRYFVDWHTDIASLPGSAHLFVACSTAPPTFSSLAVWPCPVFHRLEYGLAQLSFLVHVWESLGTRLTWTGAIYYPGLYTHGGSLISSPHREPSHLSWVWGQLDSINISHSEIIVARCFIITCKHVKVWIKPHFKVTPSAPPCKVG